MKSLTIYDPRCEAAYDFGGLDGDAPGEVEGTVLRVAERLARGRPVALHQRSRLMAQSDRGVALSRLDAPPSGDILVIDSGRLALRLREDRPGARIRLWLHAHPDRTMEALAPALAQAGIGVTCVSETQAEVLRAFLHGAPMPRIDVVPDPVDDDLQPDDTPRDPDRLLFASAPHKGLADVCARFADVRALIPTLSLHVSGPGTERVSPADLPQGAVLVGPLPRAELLRQMRRSLCLFAPQTTFAETFGVAVAEANAVGTPALLHPWFGANAEVVSSAWQLVDARDPAAIAERLRRWRADPPQVSVQPRFRLAAVAAAWEALLDDPAATDPSPLVAA